MDVPAVISPNVEVENVTVEVQGKEKVSSLSAIAAEYGDSDSEVDDKKSADDVIIVQEEVKENEEIPKANAETQIYRIQTKAYCLSTEDEESDSTESSSESSTSSSSEDEDNNTSANKERKDRTKKGGENKLKCEWDDLPPIEDLKISVPEVLCDPLGEVAWMVEQLVIVKPKPEKPTLNLDTVLFIDKGQRALGKIFDVFGPVTDPHYSVRFNSTDHIKESDIRVGMTVYYCPNTEYTSLVFLHELAKMKGTDVNGEDEPPDFSDDEEERLYYENLKKEQGKNKTDTEVPHKKSRNSKSAPGWQSNHPWNRNRQRRDGQSPKPRQGPPPPRGQLYNNSWYPYFYQNCWPPGPYRFNSPFEMQPMQYPSPNGNNSDQTGQNPQSYTNENGTGTPRGPFIPNARFPPNFPPHNFSRAPHPGNFRNTDLPWQMQSQIPMNAPWAPMSQLPPPPPPPPPLSSNDS